MGNFSGKALTVLGPIDSNSLGITLMHEHLFINELAAYFKEPKDAATAKMAHERLKLENLGWVRFNPLNNEDNLRLDDEDLTIEEALRFKNRGGKTIVDVTTIGLGRDPEVLKRFSARTGLNVVAGAGYYVAASHPSSMASRSIDDIKNEIVKEIRDGIKDTGVRAGIIGEIGTTYPWGTHEQKVLRGAARAQIETGASLEIHPGRNPNHPRMIIDLLRNEGADLSRTVICHIERTVGQISEIKSIVNQGCFVEFDLFGQAWYPFELNFPFPSDAMRVHQIKQLVDAGHSEKILISQDIDQKFLLRRYAGHGYAHILENIIPLMERCGISGEIVSKILIESPRKLLTLQ